MTFDEAFKQVEQLANFEVGKTTGNIRRDFKLELGDVRDILAELRKEYAPTILLTQNEYKELKAGHTLEEKIARISRLAHNSSDDSADGYVNDDMIMRSYLFPETIKVVDE